MNCSRAQHHLFAADAGALPEEDRAALAAHLEGCTTCRRLEAGLAFSLDAWRNDTAAVRVPNADFEWQKIRRQLHGMPAPRRNVLAWIAMPVAAAAAIALGVYIAPETHPSGRATTPVAVSAPAAAPAGAGAMASTVVFVDDKSGWTFVWGPENGSRADRRI